MELTAEERGILAGSRGEAARRALEYQIEVGRFWGAKRFVPVTNVHMMGDIEVMGDAGLEFIRNEARTAARCAVATTTNARCIDFAYWDRLGQDAAEVAKERELIECLRRMDVVTTDTCINYQSVYQPHLGEHVAWGDTGTVIYANSVFGARSNFESGPAALAAALTGRTPEYGFHLAQNRKGTFAVRLEAKLDDLADWGAVGKIVGEAHQDYFAVPVFHGDCRVPSADELKHLGAALASYGSMGMFHFMGVTPEAPASVDGLVEKPPITDEDISRVYAGYNLGNGDARRDDVAINGAAVTDIDLLGRGQVAGDRSRGWRNASEAGDLERRVECIEEPVPSPDLRVALAHGAQRVDRDIGREGDGPAGRSGRDGAIVPGLGMRRAARGVGVEAARHAVDTERARFVERAEFFHGYSLRTLATMPTARLARPVVLMLRFGGMRDCFRRMPNLRSPEPGQPLGGFGKPTDFVPQKVAALRTARRLVYALAASAAALTCGRRTLRRSWCGA